MRVCLLSAEGVCSSRDRKTFSGYLRAPVADWLIRAMGGRTYRRLRVLAMGCCDATTALEGNVAAIKRLTGVKSHDFRRNFDRTTWTRTRYEGGDHERRRRQPVRSPVSGSRR